MYKQISYSANQVFNYFSCSDDATSRFDTVASILEFERLEKYNTSNNIITFSLPIPTNNIIWQILPTLTININQPYSYYFSLECCSDSDNECAVLTNIGSDISKDKIFTSKDIHSDNVLSDVDSFLLNKDFNKILLHLHVDEELLNSNEWFVSVSLKCKEKTDKNCTITDESFSQSIPEISQMLVPDIGPRICSPTCLTMLLQSYSRDVSPATLAKLAYVPQFDLYGVWPANLYAASHYHTLGGVLFFDDWEKVKALLRKDIPLITSIRYGKGELSNCAIERKTSKPEGHLILLKGFDNEYVVVNDPAAPNNESVSRKYLLEEFLKVWIERSAVGYVILPL